MVFFIYLCFVNQLNNKKMKKLSASFHNDLDVLESQVANYFSELLQHQKEIVIFSETDLEHETPNNYLEYRNDITGNVIDVHPLKVTYNGILVVSADGNFVRHLIKLQDLGSVQDRIILCDLMEDNLD